MGIYDQTMIAGPFTDSVTTALRAKNINTPQQYFTLMASCVFVSHRHQMDAL